MIQHDFIQHGYEQNKRYTADMLFTLAVKLFAVNAILKMAMDEKMDKKAFNAMLGAAMKMLPFAQISTTPSLFIAQMTNSKIAVPAFVLTNKNDFTEEERNKIKWLQVDVEALALSCEKGFQTLGKNSEAEKTDYDHYPMNTPTSVAEQTALRAVAFLFTMTCFFGSIAAAAVMGDNINIAFACIAAAVVSYYGVPKVLFGGIESIEEKKLARIYENHQFIGHHGKEALTSMSKSFSVNISPNDKDLIVTAVQERLTPPTEHPSRKRR